MFISTLTLRNVDYLRIVAVMLLFALSLASANVMAGDDIDIDSARWSSDRDRLTVRGEDAPDDGIVTIRYGEKDDNGAVIGTTQADDDGDWEFRIRDIDPVPCDVTAIAGGDDDDKEVRRADARQATVVMTVAASPRSKSAIFPSARRHSPSAT